MYLLIVDKVVLGIIERTVSVLADAFAMERFVFHHAVEEGSGGGDAFGCTWAFVDEFGKDTQGLAIAFKAAMWTHHLVEFTFTNVTERWMPHVVSETHCFS